MNPTKLKEYTTALNALPKAVKNNLVSMDSVELPTCNTPGCHSGLISIAAEYLPELKKCYIQVGELDGYDLDCDGSYDYTGSYSYTRWANALALYLGFPITNTGYTYHSLTRWANDNPHIWDNAHGLDMFISGEGFGQETDFFPHSVIIDHFTAMSARLNNE